MIFNDLQAACRDLEYFTQSPERRQYGDYVDWTQCRNISNADAFWRHNFERFQTTGTEFPNFGLSSRRYRSNEISKGTLDLPNPRAHADFALSVIGHAAWALVVWIEGKTSESNFISMNPARKVELDGIQEIMGPVNARVPVRVPMNLTMPIQTLLSAMKSQSNQAIGMEHRAMMALQPDNVTSGHIAQGLFQWNPPDSDITGRKIVWHDEETGVASLQLRGDLSCEPTHDHGLLVCAWEQVGAESIRLSISWNSDIMETRLVSAVYDRFRSIWGSIVSGEAETIADCLSPYAMRADHKGSTLSSKESDG